VYAEISSGAASGVFWHDTAARAIAIAAVKIEKIFFILVLGYILANGDARFKRASPFCFIRLPD
jgi:hypothetical protein